MKPNFALSLSFDGIRLMHRSGAGWTIVGDVPLDSSDLAGELAMLRKTALSLDPAGLRTKILLPNDQIKYLALDTTRATEDDVLAALDGATPYKVADLVYDYVKGAGRTYIAAVARETLAEAEAFAAEHRFAPVSFAGVPEEFTYLGESFFGQTKASQTLLPAGEKVERDGSPVRVNSKPARVLPQIPVIDTPTAIVAPASPVTPVVGSPAVPVASEAPPVVAAALETVVPPPTVLTDTAPLTLDKPVTVEPTKTPVAEVLPVGAAAPAVVVPAPVDVTLAAIPPHEPVVERSTVPSEAEPVPTPAASAPMPESATQDDTMVEPVPMFASRSRPLRARADGALPPAKPLPPAIKDERASPPIPVTPATPERVEPVFTRRSGPAVAVDAPVPTAQIDVSEPIVAAAKQPEPPMQLQKPVTNLAVPVSRDVTGPALTGAGRITIDSVGLAPRTGNATPPPPAMAPAVTGMSGAAKSATTVAASIAPIRTAPFTPPVSQNSVTPSTIAPIPSAKPAANVVPLRPPVLPSDQLDVGAAQRKQATEAAMAKAAARPARTRSRYLGLILTVILLLAMAAVATWAKVTDQSLSSLFGGADDTTEVAGVVAVPVAIPTPQADTEETAVILPEVGTEEPQVLSEPVDEAAVDTPIVEEDIPENMAAVTEPAPQSDASPPDAAAAAAAAAAVATAIAALPQDPAAEAQPLTEEAALSPSLTAPVEPVEGTVVSADEADRFYAATGVWLRAPRLPLTPETDVLDDLYTAGTDAAVAERTGATLAALGPDPGLTIQLNPPAPGTRFPRDDRGFILATPEGTLTPDGLMIFAGQPSILPPTRPGTAAPVTEASVANGEVAAAAPLDAADVLALTAPDMAAAAALLAPSWRPTKRPEARPESEVAAVLPEETPAALSDATVVDETTAVAPDGTVPPTGAELTPDEATAGAVSLAGIRPLVRPDSIVPETEAEATPTLAAYDGTRPSTRPDGLAPEGVTSSPADAVGEVPDEAAPADMSATLASIVQGAADPLAGATAQAVALASRPDARPTNFSRVVEQQTARLERAQPAAAAVASAAPASNASPEEQAETAPEVASSAAAAPSGPVPGGVAQAATLEGALAMREVSLVGVFGTPSDRRALVRMPNGRILRVSVGDSLDGGQVTAIGDSALNYVKRGRTIALQVPQGG